MSQPKPNQNPSCKVQDRREMQECTFGGRPKTPGGTSSPAPAARSSAHSSERPRSAPGVRRGSETEAYPHPDEEYDGYADERGYSSGPYGDDASPSPGSAGSPYSEYDDVEYPEDDLDAEAEGWLHRVVGAAQETMNQN